MINGSSMREEEYKEKKGYIKDSKKVFIEIYTELMAHELYLDNKYHKDQNNTLKMVWDLCYHRQWILEAKEQELLFEKVLIIAEKKYGFKYSKV